jgi:antitoxin VapB
MRTVSILINDKNQVIQLPKDMEYQGISELEISKEGDTLILRPARTTWLSLAGLPKADEDFLTKRN